MLYSDLNLSKTDKKTKVLDLEDILQSIKTIVFVRKRTRLFNRDFGSDIPALLFEPMDLITANLIKLETFGKIERFEPRVKMLFQKSILVPNYQTKVFSAILKGTIPGLDNLSFQINGSLSKNPLISSINVGVEI